MPSLVYEYYGVALFNNNFATTDDIETWLVALAYAHATNGVDSIVGNGIIASDIGNA
jgi:hypothetical protein